MRTRRDRREADLPARWGHDPEVEGRRHEDDRFYEVIRSAGTIVRGSSVMITAAPRRASRDASRERIANAGGAVGCGAQRTHALGDGALRVRSVDL